MKAKLNLTINPGVAQEARGLGINMSRVAERAIAQASKAERNRRWVEANRTGLDTYAAEVAREGLPLAKYRTF